MSVGAHTLAGRLESLVECASGGWHFGGTFCSPWILVLVRMACLLGSGALVGWRGVQCARVGWHIPARQGTARTNVRVEAHTLQGKHGQGGQCVSPRWHLGRRLGPKGAMCERMLTQRPAIDNADPIASHCRCQPSHRCRERYSATPRAILVDWRHERERADAGGRAVCRR